MCSKCITPNQFAEFLVLRGFRSENRDPIVGRPFYHPASGVFVFMEHRHELNGLLNLFGVREFDVQVCERDENGLILMKVLSCTDPYTAMPFIVATVAEREILNSLPCV